MTSQNPDKQRPASSDAQANLPSIVQHVDPKQIKQFVTQIKSAEQQVGEHIVKALQDDETVAVLTTVVVGGDGGQHIVSAALDPKILQQVQHLLRDAQSQRHEEIPCIGFHCLLKRKDQDDEATEKSP